MKILKKYKFLIILALLILAPVIFYSGVNVCYAENIVDEGYYVDNYNINIDVAEDNVYTVTEDLHITYLGPQYGPSRKYYRYIPYAALNM